MYTVYLNGLIKNIVVIESIHNIIIERIKMFQCFKLPSCLLKYLVGSLQFRLLKKNADLLKLLNLSD